MEESGEDPVLVAYSFQFDMTAIKKRSPMSGFRGRKDDMRDWNAGRIGCCSPPERRAG